jgi:hypothetical protein
MTFVPQAPKSKDPRFSDSGMQCVNVVIERYADSQ